MHILVVMLHCRVGYNFLIPHEGWLMLIYLYLLKVQHPTSELNEMIQSALSIIPSSLLMSQILIKINSGSSHSTLFVL